MAKEMLSVRVHSDTKKRIQKYAEEHDVTQSTAIRRLIEKGMDLEEAGLTVAAASQDTQEGGTGNRLYHSVVQATDYLVNGGFALLIGTGILWVVGLIGILQLSTFELAFLMLVSMFGFLAMVVGISLLLVAEAIGILADWLDHDRTVPDLRRLVVKS